MYSICFEEIIIYFFIYLFILFKIKFSPKTNHKMLVAQIAYIIYVGGDVFLNSRFLILLIPILVVLFFDACDIFFKKFYKKIKRLKRNNMLKEIEFFKSDYIASKDVNAWLGIYKVKK